MGKVIKAKYYQDNFSICAADQIIENSLMQILFFHPDS
jgi:hypothetical protein